MATDTMQKSVSHYENMRDSGIEWLGAVPSHWSIYTLGQLAIQVKNKNLQLQENNLLSLSYGKIKRKNIETKEGLLPASFDNYNIIDAGDIVLRLTDLQNDHTSLRVGLATEKGIITSAYVTLRPKNLALSGFMYYILHAFDIRKGFYGMGTGVRQGLKFEEVRQIKLCVPSPDVQQDIVDYLNQKCALIDSFIVDAKTSIEEYKSWKSSIIYEAVTKGLNPNVEMKDSGVEWIGKIPVAWSVCALKRLTVKIGSGKTPLGGAETYISQGVLFLRSQNIYDTGLRLDNASYISPEVNESMGNTQVKCGDVLLNITGGSIGRCCVYDLNGVAANVNQHVCIIRTQYEVLRPQYLRYFWNSAAGPMIISHYQTGGNRPGLNFEQIGSVKIPLCDVAVQDSIVKYLDKKTRKIDKLIQEKQDLIADLESYKKSLIYEVVTGKRKVV